MLLSNSTFFKIVNCQQIKNKMNIEENINEDKAKLAWSAIRQKLAVIENGGGKKSIEKQHQRGKLFARERIKYLLDDDSSFIEIGAFAGYEMYEEQGGCPAAGVVGGIGYISGRQCIVVANDQTVKAGAWFPMTGKKNLRFQEIAMENHLPIIYIVDSAGVFLPMQDEIFPDKENFGRIFRNNAKMSAMGITQIAVVTGACVAGGAYLPIMSDETIMVEGAGSIFLAGPYLVKAAIGEEVDAEALGGAVMHNSVSGVADYKFDTEEGAFNQVKKIMSKMGEKPKAGFNKIDSIAPQKNVDDIYKQQSEGNKKPYDMLEIIRCIVDADSFEGFKEDYGQTIICGYARIQGWAVGIVANQRLVVKSKALGMQLGGVIYNDSADKAARFIMNCNQKSIPLVFLQDVTGFMVGSKSEQSGIIKDGAKMVNAVANSVVPKFTIIVGNSYGAGNYAMCGKAYDPRLIFAWPSAKIAVMGGEQAAKTMLQIQVSSLKAKGQEISPEEENEILQRITENYTRQTLPEYAAARLWVDGIIDPKDTRNIIAEGIKAANNNPHIEDFKMGVFQV
jgi:acetyl-CoA carboxylase carboxyltransferase component